MEPTLPSPSDEEPISLGERCMALAIKVMKPVDGPGLDTAIAYGRKIHAAVLDMEAAERRRIGVPGAPRMGKGPNRQLTDDEFATIERMAKAQATYGAIAKATKLPHSTIRGVIKRKGWRDAPAPKSGQQESGAAPGVIGRSDRAEDVGGTAPPSPGPVALPPAVADADPDTTISATPGSASIGSITGERLDRAKERYEAGDPVKAIAVDLNCSAQTVYNLATKHSWLRPHRAAAAGVPSQRQPLKPVAAPEPAEPISVARRQAIESVGQLARSGDAALAVKRAGPPLPDGDPDRDVMLMDGPELAKAVRGAGFALDQIAGSTVPQWRIRGAEVLGLLELRRVVAGLRLLKAAE